MIENRPNWAMCVICVAGILFILTILASQMGFNPPNNTMSDEKYIELRSNRGAQEATEKRQSDALERQVQIRKWEKENGIR